MSSADDQPLIEVHERPEDLATSVAGALMKRIAEAQASGHVPHVALTGGTIADRVHREVARMSRESDPGAEVDWSRVEFWWGDERFVAADSPERNEGQARAAFLDEVDVDPARVHPMPSTDAAESAEAGAEAYAAELRTHGAGRFDVVMLGVGPDAHVASLFPGHPAARTTAAIAVAVHDSPKPPPDRISLTAECLSRSAAVWFLASGPEKAEAVALALTPGVSPVEAPASGVSGEDETVWFLDRDAASRL